MNARVGNHRSGRLTAELGDDNVAENEEKEGHQNGGHHDQQSAASLCE